MNLIDDDVVISGVGGYFPQCKNIDELKKHLFNNKNLVEPYWKNSERGVVNIVGKVETDRFDNAYFGIHRQQSTFMDPMHRLILERTFEALVDAGVNPSEIRGKKVGVFMASAVGETDNLFLESIISGFGVTGHCRAMMSNRISYWLNLKGPSVAYNSNWAGGIEVLKLAFDAIRSGQCESVIIGTANLALYSEFQWLYNDMGVLSPDGSTKVFDANANGYARSDGIVVLYIQRASLAKRSYASIVNVASTFDGNYEKDLLNINVSNLVEFMENFYKNTEIDPSQVEYLETYGCALKNFDKIELDAIEKVYCKNRESPLLVGSIKSNTGHSESSASLFSLVKILIAMESQTIPATIQYDTPNPEITPLVNGTIEVVTDNRPWKAKYAALNSIGLDSYYGHVLLKSNPKKKTEKNNDVPVLILASTRTEKGMKDILETVKLKAEKDPEYVLLIHDLFSKPFFGHLYRGYTILGSEVKMEIEHHAGNKRPIVFVYSGMGSQWLGMVSDLMKIEIFAKSIRKSCEILKPKGIDLMHILTSKDKDIFENILNSFVGIAAIQIALTDIIHAIGIVPDVIIGHSVGELGCAYADGCLTAEQMILSAYSRGRASLEANLIKGMMAAIGMGYQQIKDKCPASIEVACHNGPDSSTISGPTEDMEIFVKQLQDEKIFARLVNVSNIAYHSRYIKPAAPKLHKYLSEIIKEPKLRSSKWISTSNLEENWNTDLAKYSSADYHTNNLLSSVVFEEGLKHIPKDSVMIEIAPHGLLQAILKRSLKIGCTNIALTQRGSKSGVEFLFSSLGKLYLAGLNMNISNLYPTIEYPVGRGTSTLANLVHWEHSEVWKTGLEDRIKSLFGVEDIQVTLNSEEFRHCVGHQLDDKIILPCGSYLNHIYNIMNNVSSGLNDIIFENLSFKKVLIIPKLGSVLLHAMIQKGSGDFEILADNEIIVTGRVVIPSGNDKIFIDIPEIDIKEDRIILDTNDIYNEFIHRGHHYTGMFKTMKNLIVTEKGSISTAQWKNKWFVFLDAMIQQHLFQDGERTQEIFTPRTIQKIVISQKSIPSNKNDIKIVYDYATNVIASEGMQIIGLTSTSLLKDKKLISYDSIEFISFHTTFTTMENCLNVAFQLAVENFNDPFLTNASMTEIKTDNISLIENAKNVANQYPKLNITTKVVTDMKNITSLNTHPHVIIFNSIITDEIANLISTSKGFLFIPSNKAILLYPEIIEIAQVTYNNVNYSILRRIKLTKPTIVRIKGDTLSIKDVSRGSVQWVNDLENAQTMSRENNSIFLISNIIPAEGVKNFTYELLSLPTMTNVRLLFNFDKTSIDDEHIFKKDLILSVIKNGIYGTYIPIPINIKQNIFNNLTIINNSLNNIKISYIGINLRDETLDVVNYRGNELGNLDYSGIDGNGRKIAGLAQMDQHTCNLVPDSILNWELPELYNLEDAATLPHAYISAYYCLFIKAKLKPGETILIHSGCSAIGMAMISIAFLHGCTIYTTVSMDTQKAFLKKNFTWLKNRNILSSNNTNFQALLLMATGGIGAQVIINCLSGNRLQSSIGCLASFGRFIQIGKYDFEENTSFGMSIFLKNTSFYAVNLENIFNLSDDVKKQLKSLVQHGLEKLSVRPIIRKVLQHQDVNKILNQLKEKSNIGKVLIKIDKEIELNKFIINKNNQFICSSKSSYLIYGGTAENWVNIIEWLVFRGARKIIVSSDCKPQQPHLNRRLLLLQTFYRVDIILAQTKVHTKEGANELLSDAHSIGSIHAVFLLPNKCSTISKISGYKFIQYLEESLRNIAPKAMFVNFVDNAGGICQIRAEADLPTYNIQWSKTLQFSNILYAMDDIFSLKVKSVFIKNDKIIDSKQETTQSLFKKLTLLMPQSIEQCIQDTKEAPLKPQLIQLPTIGPREIRELAPVFIIPGISGLNETYDLAYQLLYPTFCAILPSAPMSLKELAQSFVLLIKNVWPKGPYNIIGISWGGALMIEIAKLLLDETQSHNNKPNLHLFFIDAAPNTLQLALKHLGDEPVKIETNLLNKILNINNNDVLNEIQRANTWEKRLNIALNNYNYKSPLTDRISLELGLTILKTRLEDLHALQPTKDLISGQIHLIRPIGSSKYDNCGLVTYCEQTPQINLVNEDHINIINNHATAKYINEKHYLI